MAKEKKVMEQKVIEKKRGNWKKGKQKEVMQRKGVIRECRTYTKNRGLQKERGYTNGFQRKELKKEKDGDENNKMLRKRIDNERKRDIFSDKERYKM